jgi:hypothetical protein
MLEIYLPETNERQFLFWLNTYCWHRSADNIIYPFSTGWSYKLYYDILGAQSSASFTARVYRAFYQESRETTETMADNIKAINVEWQEVGDRLKVTISHHDGDWVMPPLQDLVANIRQRWPEATSSDWP